MKILLLLHVTILLVFASNLDNAVSAFKTKQYNKAFKLYTQEAENNNSVAQNALSYLYFNGIGTNIDIEKGKYWLKRAALQADSVAQYDMAMMYLSGNNFEKSNKEALFWLERSADLGNKDAQFNIALMYYNGDGVEQNITKTAAYLNVSAKNAHIKARQLVGRIYMQILDFDHALNWLKINANEGDIEASYLIAEIYCTQGEYKQAEPWISKAINNNYEKANQLKLTCKEVQK